MAGYQLWNTTTANLIGEFRSEDEALESVAHDIRDMGRTEATRGVALGRDDFKGPVIKGAELARLALERFPERKSA